MAKKKPKPGKQPDPWWRAGSIAVFLVALSVTLLTTDDVGLTWDEPFSIFAGRDYATWFAKLPGGALRRDTIDEHWRKNHEHPPLAKLAMGMAQMALGDKVGMVHTSRFAAAFLFALLVEAVFLFGGRTFGGLAGVFAAASLLCMPRVFGHGHLASLDVPMALTWLLAVAAFARAVRKGAAGACALTGLCFGLALLTKINAVLLPLVLVIWGVGWYRKRVLWTLAWTIAVGGLVFFVGWPWLWPDVRSYLGIGGALTAGLMEGASVFLLPLFALAWGLAYWRRPALRTCLLAVLVGGVLMAAGWVALSPDLPTRLWLYLRPSWRVSIPVLYFGRVYAQQAPFHYPLVMTLVTVPVGILFLSGVGFVGALRRFRREPMLALLVVNVAAILGVFMMPGVPKYDGVRLFLPVFPFVALLAGVGGQRCWAWVARRAGRRHRLPLLLSVVFFMSQAGAVALIHPYELSYYNALTGGLWGAHKLGLETTYWHDAVNRRLFRWLNDPRNPHCRQSDAIAFYPVGEYVVRSGPPRGTREPNDLYELYYLLGPKHLRAVRFERGVYFDLLVLNAREAMLRKSPTAWRIFTTARPIFEIRKQGVLLCAVYQTARGVRRSQRVTTEQERQ